MRKFLYVLLFICLPAFANASEVMTSARQIGLGRVSAVAYYARNEQDADFGTRGSVNVVSDSMVGKVSLLIWDKWHMYVKAGKTGVDIESGSDTYTKADDFDGNIYGAGIKCNLFPDTMVTPAISVEVGVTSYKSQFDELHPTNIIIDQELSSLEYQGTMYISKKFFALEPYLGLKVIRNDFEWKDKDPSAVDKKIEGDTTGVSPFLGVRFNFLPMIGLTVEGSFVKEKTLSVGLTAGF